MSGISIDVVNDTMICVESDEVELPKDTLAWEMVSIAGNSVGRFTKLF